MLGIAIGGAVVAGVVFGMPAVPVVLAVAMFDGVSRWRFPWLSAVLAIAVIAGATRAMSVVDEPESIATGNRTIIATVDEIREGRDTWRHLNVRSDDGVTYCASVLSSARIGLGDRLAMRGNVARLGEVRVERAAALRQVGCGAVVEVSGFDVLTQGSAWQRGLQELRETVSQRFTSTIKGDAGALLAGLVIGDDSDLSPETRDAFYRTSMSHITAVSGSNLALLTWLMVAGPSRRRWPVQVAVLGALWAYVMLAGAGPSTVRAGLTATLCAMAPWLGRRADILTVASLVAAIQVLVRPELIDRVAFQLSTVATLAMLTSLTGVRGTGWTVRVRQIVIPVVAIQLATLPFAIGEDQAILAAIVANILSAPLVALAFVCGAISALLFVIWEPAGVSMAVTASLPAELIIEVVQQVAVSPLGELRLNPDDFGSRLVLGVALAVLVFGIIGRHSRRGIGDAWERLAASPPGQRMGWTAMAVGGLMALLVERVAR